MSSFMGRASAAGKRYNTITGIREFEDANCAGMTNSEKCTLILTQDLSTKALAMAGVSVVGRDCYGVYPLSGELLNVREASIQQITENGDIKKILGLKTGMEYNSVTVKRLRYGHLMIMTDQDHDGSYIKGLIINFFHTFWPSLLKIPGFLSELITPVVKVTHAKNNKTVMCFYSMPEYETWLETLGGNSSGWDVKYCKKLKSHTLKEGKEYFSDLAKHNKCFVWVDEQDGEAIRMAFSSNNNNIEATESWLKKYEPGPFLDRKGIRYKDFVYKELVQFSIADLQRCIPSVVDGLKPGQRKIVFCSFKCDLVKAAAVAEFAGYVAEHSAYHEESRADTIIGLAQNFVGSNNINLLEPNGKFGSRHQGGKDHASTRYLSTCLSPITRFLFPKDDDILLDYLKVDGQSIEPTWYVPVIPTVLVNGSEHIGTGLSTFIPNYNPRDIVANLKRLLNGEPMVPMDPWYNGFSGAIEKIASMEGVYAVTGVIDEVTETTLWISELPVRSWTEDYKEFLESMMTGNDKVKEPFVKDYIEQNDGTVVRFKVILSKDNMMIAKKEGILQKFKLTKIISTNNMHLFDPKGALKKYDNPEQILEDFYGIRLEFYKKRKRVLLEDLELELKKLDNKVRFILGIVNNEIRLSKWNLVELLHQEGFDAFPENTKSCGSSKPKENGYEYLLSLPVLSLSDENVQELCNEKLKLEGQVEELKSTTEKSLWMKDLESLEKTLDEQDGKRKVTKDAGKKAAKQAPKNTRKYTKRAITSVLEVAPASSSLNIDDIYEVTEPKGKGGPRKRPAKKGKPSSVDTDEENELVELKNRLAAYLDSSTDEVMESEHDALAKKKIVTRRVSAARKKV